MKRLMMFAILPVVILEAAGQNEIEFAGKFRVKENSACDARVELADSSINYQYNAVNGIYLPVSVIQYFYNESWNVSVVIKKTLPERVNIYRQIFEYNNDQNIVKYTYQIWTESGWKDNLINERTYTPEGIIDTEVFIRENTEGIFTPYQQHFYVNEAGRIISYLRQVKNAGGNWYNFSEHIYVYDSLGRLTILYGKYYNTDLIYWERTSVYGDDGNISERYLKQLKYNQAERKNILTNISLQKYHYNLYGSADTLYNYVWEGQDWQYASKDVAYFSLISKKKVSICHNGTNLCVPSNVVKIHLEHGDKLGECDTSDPLTSATGHFSGTGGQETKCFSIFPNPAETHITIKIESDPDNYNQAIILSSDGKIMTVCSTYGNRETRCNISRFRSGTYFVRLIKTEGFETQAFIKN
jgi:hypothetical protein